MILHIIFFLRKVKKETGQEWVVGINANRLNLGAGQGDQQLADAPLSVKTKNSIPECLDSGRMDNTK